jgi:DNA helicase-2/ATP-dependent DNA helicase PcrA
MTTFFENELNQRQNEALLVFDKPLLILAGAGSGKTRTITYKIAYLIKELEFTPQNILALTFTNKAAEEMKNRVSSLLKGDKSLTRGMWVSTFHSFCARLLRREAHHLGYDNNFTIYDTSDSKSLVKDILKSVVMPYGVSASDVYFNISKRKNSPYPKAEDFINDFYKDKLWHVFKEYEKRLFEQNAMDFDNLILKTIELLATKKEVLDYYSNIFRYILIDEFQDTNDSQYELIRLLSKTHNNITIVGDDDQSIYAFRGAKYKNLIQFTEDFENTQIIRLEQNYRSTKSILQAANSVIEKNKSRLGKTLWCDNTPHDESIKIMEAYDEREEGKLVVSSLKDALKKGNDVGIFFRVNSQSRVFEDVLIQNGLKGQYELIGGFKFYERREIKDIIGYLNFIVNPKDNLSLKRIINIPKRGIGEKSVSEIESIASELNLPLYNGVKYAIDNDILAKGVTSKLKSFTELIDTLAQEKDNFPPNEFIKRLIKKCDYITYISGDEDFEERAGNIDEFIKGVEERLDDEPGLSLEEIMHRFALVNDTDTKPAEKIRIFLMTVHNAKGLEFDTVYITGLEEGMLPHFRSLDTAEEIEEERRLFYVAITRAKKNLYISYANSRKKFGSNYIMNKKSRFIDELDADVVENASIYGGFRKQIPVNIKKTFAGKISHDDTLEKKPYALSADEVNPGEILYHEKYGEGKVLEVNGSGYNALIRIDFEEGIKQFILKFANLRKKEQM